MKHVGPGDLQNRCIQMAESVIELMILNEYKPDEFVSALAMVIGQTLAEFKATDQMARDVGKAVWMYYNAAKMRPKDEEE